MKIHWWNLSHDVQLAVGHGVYNANAAVKSLEKDLQPLALWCAEDGDAIVIDAERLALCRDWQMECWKPTVQWRTAEKFPHAEISPWGWNRDLVRRVMFYSGNKAAMRAILPSASRLDAVRSLSSRQFSVKVLSAIRSHMKGCSLVGDSCFCQDMNELTSVRNQWGNMIVMKAPWSSSGRGLRMVRGEWTDELSRWAEMLMERQGGVEVEPYYAKMSDWALEFVVDSSGKVTCTGLSRFHTSVRGEYRGSRVAGQHMLRSEWGQFLSEKLLDEVTETLCNVLSDELSGHYVGPVGVDMIICDDKLRKTCMLHPCIEVNLRKTMGQLAVCLSRVVADGKMAHFEILHGRNGDMLRQRIAEKGQPRWDGLGHLAEGGLALTPIAADSCFAGCLSVEV